MSIDILVSEVGGFVPAKLLPLSVSKTHGLKNVRRTHAQMLEGARRIVAPLRSLPAERQPKLLAVREILRGAVPAEELYGCTPDAGLPFGFRPATIEGAGTA